MPVLCFIIHGIGTQNQDFSDPLQRGVQRELAKLIVEKKSAADGGKCLGVEAASLVDFQTLYWANVESDEQNNLYRKIYPELFTTERWFKKVSQLVTQLSLVRSLSIKLIGDIFGYLGRFQEPIKRGVFDQIAGKLGPRLESGEPFSIILVGHSLGSVILHDLISGFLRYRYAGFDSLVSRISVFTMGSPLSLFSLVAESADPKRFHKWVNFLHPRDPVAFPMAKLFPNVEDVKLSGFSWNPVAVHSVYWHHHTVHRRIAKEIFDHFDKSLATPSSVSAPAGIAQDVFQPFHAAAAHAGFSSYFADFHTIPFADLIPEAKEIDICNVYGGHWVEQNAQYIVQALCNPDTVVRVCTLSPESPSLPGFSYHFTGMPEEKIKEKIEEGKNEYLKAHGEARRRVKKSGHLQIYRSKNIVNHSFYRFDDAIYYTPRPIASDKLAATPIPAFVFRNTSQTEDFFSWLMRDFELLIKTSRDATIYFDSDSPPPTRAAAAT